MIWLLTALLAVGMIAAIISDGHGDLATFISGLCAGALIALSDWADFKRRWGAKIEKWRRSVR